MDIPCSHPRHQSLSTRHKLVEAYEAGILATAGLIAHGRGEAFDYIIGEKSIPAAMEAERAAAASLLIAERPVISINGNVAVLCPEELVELSQVLGAKLEVNLFHHTPERVKNIIEMLAKHGAKNVLGTEADDTIDGIEHSRKICCRQGIGAADVVLVPLEDGDRCQALINSGKKVCTIDLNPFSRTSMSATISIMDDVNRAMNNIITYARGTRWNQAERILTEYNNQRTLASYISYINARLMALSQETGRK